MARGTVITGWPASRPAPLPVPGTPGVRQSVPFDRKESALWTQAVDKTAIELKATTEKILADNAGRGFPLPAGSALWAILHAGQDAKDKLTEGNGKIYEERSKDLFEIDEFVLKVLIRVAKLAFESYREQIFNALALEQAQAAATTERSHADVERQNLETEKRTVAIIQQKAELEQSIIPLQQQLVALETQTLGSERVLVQAQLETAEKKLEIIDSIYRVLAAEQLVLAAENRRAAALQRWLAAELIVAGIKQEMVPFYLQKASAQEALALAITQEIPVTEALIRLGYDRIALKDAEEAARHVEAEAQDDLELLKEQAIRANTTMELTRMANHRLLLEYRNIIQAQVMELKKAIQEDEVTFRLATGLEREAIGVNNEVALTHHEIGNLTQELINFLQNIVNRATDHAATVRDGASTRTWSAHDANKSRRIQEGFVTIIQPPPQIG